jgi:hypothetical protein
MIGELKLSGNVRARSMDVQNLRCNNVSVVRELYCNNISAANISADEICAKRVKAEGDITARILISLASISAKDLLVDYVSAVKDISIKECRGKGQHNHRKGHILQSDMPRPQEGTVQACVSAV